MRRWIGGVAAGLALTLATTACESSDSIVIPGGGGPGAPEALDAYYYAGAVYVTWELGTTWNGEPFRVYARRSTDADFFLIAEVTNCSQSLCSYTDVNIEPGRSYDYYVAAVDEFGDETATAEAVRVPVPEPVPPPAPDAMEVVALDNANYLRWGARARDTDDFSHYRVYLFLDEQSYLLGETDSEGFLDLLAENGATYSYFATSVDDQGHESEGSAAAEGTPRPDFHGDVVWDYFTRPADAGFAFRETEAEDPLVHGDDPGRHFRLETDADGWWLVPAPDVAVHPSGFETTALKCGVAADVGCVSLDVAPTSGYVVADLNLIPETTYVLRVPGPQGGERYAAVRIQLLGFDQDDHALAIFDWAYQLQAGNPNLAPRGGGGVRVRP